MKIVLDNPVFKNLCLTAKATATPGSAPTPQDVVYMAIPSVSPSEAARLARAEPPPTLGSPGTSRRVVPQVEVAKPKKVCRRHTTNCASIPGPARGCPVHSNLADDFTACITVLQVDCKLFDATMLPQKPYKFVFADLPTGDSGKRDLDVLWTKEEIESMVQSVKRVSSDGQ